MTAVATDGKVIAADGRATKGDEIINDNVVKIFRVPKGIVGGSGDFHMILEYVAWLKKGAKKPFRQCNEGESFHIIYLREDGVWYVSSSNNCKEHEVSVPFALGSGSEYAIGAMLAGRSPRQAVQIAAQRSITVGGTIRELAL